MTLIARKEIEELAKIHDAFCVSIFIPTHRAGQESLNGKDSLELKNQIKEVSVNLEKQKLNTHDADRLLQPLYELLEDGSFWRHQSDGLALFISDGFFRKYTVPVYFEPFNYVSNEFYIKPLLSLLNDDGRFYLMSLSINNVSLYEATQHSITEIEIKDLIPDRVEEVAGYDFEQKSLQFRTQQGGKGEGMYHGHGEANEKAKDEISRYFREIDKNITPLLNSEPKLPLVICCLDTHFAEYKKVNTFKNIFPKNISGNPEATDIFTLHEKAWDSVSPYFARSKREKIDLFSEYHASNKASSSIKEIIPAAYNGRVDTLFIRNRADIFGIYDPAEEKVTVHKEHQTPNVSLLNLAATLVFLKGGDVYLTDKNLMPDPSSEVNALFRF